MIQLVDQANTTTICQDVPERNKEAKKLISVSYFRLTDIITSSIIFYVKQICILKCTFPFKNVPYILSILVPESTNQSLNTLQMRSSGTKLLYEPIRFAL